jgi:hypothetical protein
MKMQIRHIHTGNHRTSLRGLDGKIVDIGDFEDVTRGSANHRSYRVTVESEGIPAIFVLCLQCKGNNVILCSYLRGLREETRLGAAYGCNK